MTMLKTIIKSLIFNPQISVFCYSFSVLLKILYGKDYAFYMLAIEYTVTDTGAVFFHPLHASLQNNHNTIESFRLEKAMFF